MRSILLKIFAFTLALLILTTCSPDISAQTIANAAAVTSTSNAGRITQAVRENDRVTLKGNTHPLASAKNDQGLAPDSLPMERMLLVLKRSADQEASLKTLMEGQQSKSSQNFHQWLTPDQFGQQFGVSDSDIQSVTAWLQTHGFTVNRVATGKTLIEFSGTAGQVREAFQTQIHKYVVNGEQHWANSSDPTIPSALGTVISGVNALHNFKKKAMIQKRGMFSRETATGAVTPLDNVGCNGNTATTGGTCLGVGPADFAAIYHVPALVGGVAAGTGQTIAIVGDSNICTGTTLPLGCTTDDILNFRTLFGLPLANKPQVILDGPDPGVNSDEIEADLDVEYSGAIAPNAQILFVTAADTNTSNGIDLAAEHIIDYNLAPVMSESFGECEEALGNTGNVFYANLWEQAAAQGITVIISAGDNGSAACDSSNAFPNASQFGLNVNGIASTPFTVVAGGTDFDFAAAGYPASFWSAANGANGVSAKGYIPETTWNDTCAQSGLNGCNGIATSSSSPLLQVVGGSGGQSNCAVQNFIGCLQSYAKPTWQSGSGVPNDGVRDLPDISLFSSSGQLSGSFYILCASDIGGTCATGGSNFSFIAVGGTSAAAPAFAGIMALVNQNMVSNSLSGRQGNANFVLYPMSAAQTEASCNSSLGPASNCVFNDVVKGNNSVPCFAGTFACSNTVANSPNIGVLETVNATTGVPNGVLGFNTGVGYDLATGLGSLNVTNLVTGWPSAAGSFSPTTTTLTLTQSPTTPCPAGTPAGITNCISISHGQNVNVNISVTGPGTTAHPITAATGHVDDASLIGTCQSTTPNCFPGGANTAGVDRFDSFSGNVDTYPLTSGSVAASTTELIGGRYNVTAHYAGDGFNGASDSTSPIQVIVSPEGSKSTVTIFGNITTATSATYGSPLTVRTDIVGSTSGFETGTGQVTLNDTFPGWTPVLLNLNSDGHVELHVPDANIPGNNGVFITVPALGTGVHNFSAVYAGDASYTASTSAGVPFTITQGPTQSTITTFPASVGPNVNFTLAAAIATNSFGNAPTGTVSFFAGATLLGSAPVVAVPIAETSNGAIPVGGTATFTTAKIAATSSITAVYNGDVNYVVSPASAAVSVAVVVPTFTLVSASNPSVIAGTPATSIITVAPAGGFTGTVALTCSVSPSNLTSPPTCGLAPNSIVLGASQTSTLTVTTTATTALSAYTVTVTGTSGATVVTAPVTVTVVTPGNFTLASTAMTIAAPGQSGTSTITATGTGGFIGAVALTCSVTGVSTIDLPTCSVGGPINLTASTTTGTATLTVNTTAASGIPFVPTSNVRPNIRWIVGAGSAATVLTIMMVCLGPMRKRRPAIVLASLFIFVGLMVAGCGSSGGGGGTSNPGTTVGSYTVTVTGTSGTHTATTTVNVTLQ